MNLKNNGQFPRFLAHPWHGIAIGDSAPDHLAAFIELGPTDVIKYEVDKESGHLRLDRPQKFSAQCPAYYGFIPQTYCGASVGMHAASRAKLDALEGDGDPMDICVFAERPLNQNGVIITVKPIGGFRMIDKGQADDKIIATLVGDDVYSSWNDIGEIPEALLKRLKHYFLTYKEMPTSSGPDSNGSGTNDKRVQIAEIYDRKEALETIKLSMADYKDLISS